ncbi:N-acetyllactosaminide beta-1,3-N-acetylglucosaminyltransferase 3-like [Boleophthalmus pectinirostris]|uniref:N-acetyllactosaminide beta-1,3-N-acetylglucosaminyltransferase 3-like n=1 Tax=Boleophthalmus pectinirostris TaxID=150288 RepID=UPI00242AFA6F|nr:N-acetyllactosaminide beta-1,3-N-acetylglucosaminyltransferase 3-like [Boleophthalmus pectinirostris]
MLIKLRLSTFFPIAALLLFILFCVQMNNNNYYDNLNSYSENVTEEEIVYKRVIRNWPKCEQNKSAVIIQGFSSLPEHIQNFLYYRHCRHFPMLLDIPGKCGGPEKSSEVFLLLVIKSSPGNYDRREVLRKTWAKERQHDGLWIRRVFISGTSGSGKDKLKLNKLLRAEQKENSDILQWNFEESFFNLTLKQILFLEWMEKNCPKVRFLLNGDDDVFANTDGMVEYLRDIPGNNGSSHLYTGFVFENTGPVRDKRSKYYIPEQIQKSAKYEPYCGGGGYLLSGYTTMIIYNMSKSIEVHPIDDVYIGMCVVKAGYLPTHHIGVKTLGLVISNNQKLDEQEPCHLKGLLLVHRFLPAQMFLMWHKINDPQLRCGVQFWEDI